MCLTKTNQRHKTPKQTNQMTERRRRSFSIKKCLTCSCIRKQPRRTPSPTPTQPGDQQATIRLPARDLSSFGPTMVPVERWVSAPTFLSVGTSPNLSNPVVSLSPLEELPRKRRSSPGKLDASTIEQLKEEFLMEPNTVVLKDGIVHKGTE